MTSEIINKQIGLYRDNYIKYGDSPKGVHTNDNETQYMRFDRILTGIDTSKPFSIHDIGSGACSLHTYLLYKKIQHSYSGSDVVKEMVVDSQKKYPEIKLYVRNILIAKKIKKCNWVVSSGTFNLKGDIEKKVWEKYIYKMILKMFELSTYGISFNLLTSNNTYESPELAYFNLGDIYDFCIKNLSRYVTLDHSYPLYEFTTTVYKNNYIRKQFRDKVFSKYFKNDR